MDIYQRQLPNGHLPNGLLPKKLQIQDNGLLPNGHLPNRHLLNLVNVHNDRHLPIFKFYAHWAAIFIKTMMN